VAVSSNLHPAGFDQLMPKTLAIATVDRLLHHVRLCVIAGDSVRLAEATAGDGVVPLTGSPRSPRPSRRSGPRPDVPTPVSTPEVTPIEHD
jgi:hypothetical protein